MCILPTYLILIALLIELLVARNYTHKILVLLYLPMYDVALADRVDSIIILVYSAIIVRKWCTKLRPCLFITMNCFNQQDYTLLNQSF